MKKVAILGSTGSIGTQALDVIERYSSDFQVIGLSANENIDLLEQQIHKFRPLKAAVANPDKADELKRRGLPDETELLSGRESLIEIASIPDADIVIMSVVGISGLEATIAALKAGNDVALANKETLVAGGRLVMDTASRSGASIIPVDSEHSAIYQCLQGCAGHADIKKIILTASGGPFRGYSAEQLSHVTCSDALRHPNWNMGRKVTIDSATLMNKGLEVIEAKWLFGMDIDQIDVIVHPQSIIHSMVEFIDGSVIAQMGAPDMRTPIMYALTCPGRFPSVSRNISFSTIGSLTFEQPDTESFPCLSLAYDAARAGGTMPAVLNAANEMAVRGFLEGTVSFAQIPLIVEAAMKAHNNIKNPSLEDILLVDQETRNRIIKG